MILTEGETTLGEFSQLVPETVYYAYVYFDNFDGNDPVLLNTTIVTGASPPHARLDFTFNDPANKPSKTDLLATLVELFQLPEANFNLDGLTLTGGRRLSDGTAEVYSDISSDTSAAETASSSESDIESGTDSSVDVSSVSSSSYQAGAFDGDVIWGTDSGIIITLNYTVSVDGSLVCTVEANGTNLTSNEVYTGVNADGDDIAQYTDNISPGNNYFELNFTDKGYSVYGTYHVSCIVCNDYPGTPTCSDTVESTDYEYTGEESSSGAEALVVAFAAYFLF